MTEMSVPDWLVDEAQLTVAIAGASLIASVIRLVALKAFIEPAAVFIGQVAYRKADKLSGDRLPDFFPKEKTDEQN